MTRSRVTSRERRFLRARGRFAWADRVLNLGVLLARLRLRGIGIAVRWNACKKVIGGE